jgi:hypothetical protein
MNHNSANHVEEIPNRAKRKAKVKGTQAMRLRKARIIAPRLAKPAFSMRDGALKHTRARLRLIMVVRMETP